LGISRTIEFASASPDEQERDVWRMAQSIQFESKGDGDFFDEALVHAYRFIFLNRETLH
jgi:hypothetical protein